MAVQIINFPVAIPLIPRRCVPSPVIGLRQNCRNLVTPYPTIRRFSARPWISSRLDYTQLPPLGTPIRRFPDYHGSRPLGSLRKICHFQFFTWPQIFLLFFSHSSDIWFCSPLGLSNTNALISLPYTFKVHFGSCRE